MMEFAGFCGAIVSAIVLGYLALGIRPGLLAEFSRGERITYAGGLGLGIITLMMFLLSLLHIPFSPVNIVLSAALPLLLLKTSLKPATTPKKSLSELLISMFPKCKKHPPVDVLKIFLIVSISAVVLFTIFRVFILNLDYWDNWTYWAFKGKIYFSHHMIPLEKFPQLASREGTWDYPHHVPLMEAWISLWLGQWHESWVRMVFPLFWLGLGLNLYAFFKKYVHNKIALIGVFFILTLGELRAMAVGGLAEPVLIFYYVMSVILLARWLTEDNPIFLTLSAVMAGLACWTKNEGIAYTLFNLISIAVLFDQNIQTKSRSNSIFIYLCIVIGINLPWGIYKGFLHLENHLMNPQHLALQVLIHNLSNLPTTFYFLLKHFVCWPYYNIAWLTFLLMLVIHFNSLKEKIFGLLVLSIFLHLALTISLGIVDASFRFPQDSMGRVLVAPSVLTVMFTILVQKRVAEFSRPASRSLGEKRQN